MCNKWKIKKEKFRLLSNILNTDFPFLRRATANFPILVRKREFPDGAVNHAKRWCTIHHSSCQSPRKCRLPKNILFVKCIITSMFGRLDQWSAIISQFIGVVSSANNWIPDVRSIVFLFYSSRAFSFFLAARPGQ